MLSENSIYTLQQRYLRKDENGKIIETPEQLFERVSSICKDVERQKRIYDHLINLDFLPNSPTLMNTKTELGQLSACFTLPVGDSMREIFTTKLNMALVHQSGGGTGFNFSNIRPEGSPVKSTQGVASGPISFMETFNKDTDVIKQGGKRRGANMGILNDSHPDILKFIQCKNKDDKNANFNISVLVTDKFMNAVLHDEEWELSWNGKFKSVIKAKEIFNLIVKNVHDHGDPGLLFYDAINQNNDGEPLTITNPCGEQPLLPYESCNLASINLSNMVLTYENGTSFINFDKIKTLIEDLVPFMNDIIDENKYPIPEIKEATLKTRKIGIGVMGFADMLIKLDIPYNSKEALNIAEAVMEFINIECHNMSSRINPYGIRELNDNLTTIAPTGTISVIANCSSGIEPIYAVVYKRELKESMGKVMYEINSEFLKIAKEKGFYSDTLIEKILQNKGSVQNIQEIPEYIQKIFLTAHDIHYTDHVKMQASFQKYTDSAVSKTINLKKDATEKDIYESYMLAWKLGCKGITVYRNESKNQQVLVSSKEQTIEQKNITDINNLNKRDDILPGLTFTKRTGCSTLFITPTKMWNENGALELFLNKSNEKGGCLGLQDGIAIAISVYNRYLESIDHQHAINALTLVTEHLLRKTCRSSEIAIEKQKQKIERGEKINRKIDSLSCPNAIAQCLKYMLEHNINVTIDEKQINHKQKNTITSQKNIITIQESSKCPECNSTNVDSGKCGTCHDCGFSRCQ